MLTPEEMQHLMTANLSKRSDPTEMQTSTQQDVQNIRRTTTSSADSASAEKQALERGMFLLSVKQPELISMHTELDQRAIEKRQQLIQQEEEAEKSNGPIIVLKGLIALRDKYMHDNDIKSIHDLNLKEGPVLHITTNVKTWIRRMENDSSIRSAIIRIGAYLLVAMIKFNPEKEVIETEFPMAYRGSVHSGQNFMRFLIAKRRSFVQWMVDNFPSVFRHLFFRKGSMTKFLVGIFDMSHHLCAELIKIMLAIFGPVCAFLTGKRESLITLLENHYYGRNRLFNNVVVHDLREEIALWQKNDRASVTQSNFFKQFDKEWAQSKQPQPTFKQGEILSFYNPILGPWGVFSHPLDLFEIGSQVDICCAAQNFSYLVHIVSTKFLVPKKSVKELMLLTPLKMWVAAFCRVTKPHNCSAVVNCLEGFKEDRLWKNCKYGCQ